MKPDSHDLNIEDKLLLASCKLNLTQTEIGVVEQLVADVGNWEYFTKNTLLCSLGPLIFNTFNSVSNKHCIPEKTLFVLKQTYLKSLSRNMILYDHFQKAVNSFSEKGIPVIGLKGIFLSEAVYKDIGLRQMSDIDLLVKKEDVFKCRDILFSKGYISHTRTKSSFIKNHHEPKHLPPLVRDAVSIELHTKIDIDLFDFDIKIDDFWNRASAFVLYNSKVLQLNPVDLIIHFCVHLDSHFYNGNIQFFSFCDIAEALRFYENSIDWVLLESLSAKYKCNKSVYSYLFICNKYLNAPLPENIQKTAAELCENSTETLFIHYLKSNRTAISKTIASRNIISLKKVKGFKEKLKYLKGDVFPSKSFMYGRYKIQKKQMVYFYYLVRIKDGIIVLFKYLMLKKKP